MFGRSLSKPAEQIRGPPGRGFLLTKDGDYDMASKILCNVANAREKTDAVNLGTVELLVKDITHVIMEHFKPMIDELNRLRSEMNTTIAESLITVDLELKWLKSTVEPISAELNLIKSKVNNLIVDVQSNTASLKVIELSHSVASKPPMRKD